MAPVPLTQRPLRNNLTLATLLAAQLVVCVAVAPAQNVALSALGTVHPGFRIDGIDPSDISGRSVSGAGDVNGDGLADLIVRGYGADPNGNSRAGESYVIFSTATPPASANYKSIVGAANAPRVATGITGDGSNDNTPDARTWIDFAEGTAKNTVKTTVTEFGYFALVSTPLPGARNAKPLPGPLRPLLHALDQPVERCLTTTAAPRALLRCPSGSTAPPSRILPPILSVPIHVLHILIRQAFPPRLIFLLSLPRRVALLSIQPPRHRHQKRQHQNDESAGGKKVHNPLCNTPSCDARMALHR